MPRQEQGIEYYFTSSGEKRYRVRWEEAGRHRSRSFRRLSGIHGARHFYQRIRCAGEARSRLGTADQAELTLAEFVADVWAPKARRRLAKNTWATSSAIYNRHVLEALGPRPIATLDAQDLVEWQDAREADGIGRASLSKAITILSSIFAEAARRPRDTGVQINPVGVLDRPSGKARRRPRVWGPVVVERVRWELLTNSRRVGERKQLAASLDALLVALMAMTGARPGEALSLGWPEIATDSLILSGAKTKRERTVPLLAPLAADLHSLRRAHRLSANGPLFITPSGGPWAETDWRNYRSRHFVPALRRVEADWSDWRQSLDEPDSVRESVEGLAETRPYDLGRHTHSALMLASGISLQRLAAIQGHSLRVLDETYSEQLAEYEDRPDRIDPVAEIQAARLLVWPRRRSIENGAFSKANQLLSSMI